MFLLEHSSRLYAAVARMRPVYRYITTVLVVGAGGYAWFMLLYNPLNDQILQYCVQTEQLTRQIEQMPLIKKSTNTIATTIQDLDSELAAYAQNNSSRNGSLCLADLCTRASSCGLSIDRCTAQDAQDKDWYAQQTIEIGAQGSLARILQFLATLSSSHDLLISRSVSITKKSGDHFQVACNFGAITLKKSL